MDEIKRNGFVRINGQVKTPSDIRTESRSIQSSSQTVISESAKPGDQIEQLRQNLIGNVTRQANSAIEEINSLIDRGRDAARLNREANREARKLAGLYEQQESDSSIDNSPEINAAVARLSELDEQRESLERDIESGNTNQILQRQISKGEEGAGAVQAQQIQLRERKTSGAEINSSASARNFIQQNREENGDLREQISELRQERRQAADFGNTGRQQVRQIIERAAVAEELDIGAAQELASSVAREIRSLADQASAESGPAGRQNSAIKAVTDIHNDISPAKVIKNLQS